MYTKEVDESVRKTDDITYSYEDVREKAVEYFNGDELAAEAWINKYALKDRQGNIKELTPDDMHDRIATELYRVESKHPNAMSYDLIRELIDRFKYIVPQGSPMAGIGNPYQITSLSNCFVIGNKEDSYGGIFKMDEEEAQLMKRRAGVGIDVSHLRPSGTNVNNSALTSTGVVPFMERFSSTTEEVAQDGRRGALMITINIDHPDAEEFIDAKMKQGKVTGANVSVKITDAFMKAAQNNEEYDIEFILNSGEKLTKTIDAAKLWNKIVSNAWESAEPGVMFWDHIKRESIPDCYADEGFETVSTNPCGEIPLSIGDSCRLIAMNLYSFVEEPFTENAYFNWNKFREYTNYAARIMDDIIDIELERIDNIIDKIENDPEPEHIKWGEKELWSKIRAACEKGRRAGIGVTGEGDMLAALGYQYGTSEASDLSEEVHKIYAVEVFRESANLAKERGAFPVYDEAKEKGNPFVERIFAADKEVERLVKENGRRFIGNLTIAPTGTVSLMTQTTSGIECAFMVSFQRKRKINPNDQNARSDYIDQKGVHWQKYHVFHQKFEDWMKANGYDISGIKEMDGSYIDEIVQKSPYYNATSNDVDWVEKVRMQGKIQKWVDHSISVTTNLPKDITKETVNEVYKTAWEYGCKGCTIYRDGSREGVLVKNNEEEAKFDVNHAPKRPKALVADITRFQNNHEKWIGFIGLYEGRPFEIFTGKLDSFPIPNYVERGQIIKSKFEDGSSKYDFVYYDKNGEYNVAEWINTAFDPLYWDYAKIISGVLRHGMPLEYVIDLVRSLNLGGDAINTWKNGVERMIKRFVSDGTVVPKVKCMNCESDNLAYQEGCLVCNDCGSGHCG